MLTNESTKDDSFCTQLVLHADTILEYWKIKLKHPNLRRFAATWRLRLLTHQELTPTLVNSETSKFISCTKRNSNDEKAVVETNNIDTTLSEDTKLARRLNIVVRNLCPNCLQVIREVLLEEEEVSTTNEYCRVINGGST